LKFNTTKIKNLVQEKYVMKFVKLAIVLLPPCSGQYPALLQRGFAGIKMLERLILTLQRAGLGEIVILSQGSMGDIREKTEENMANDSRFQVEIIWHEQTEKKTQKNWQHIQSLIGSQNFLLMNGNMVVTATTIQDFIEQSIQEGMLEQDVIVGLEGPQIKLGNIFLSPSSKLEALKNYIKDSNTQRLGNVISLDGPKHFAKLVEDEPTARQTEKTFINLHKHNYSQFMDFWVNSYFSLKISSLLVKTSITPNALTLFGLVIGLLSAWQFAQGSYWGGLLGGLAFVGTAIWDCCDGDVARLKFMESDFGDTLDTTCDNLNNVILKKDVKKIKGTGHYLFKGKAQEDYENVINDVGETLILTSGVRNVVKQLSLYCNKIYNCGGNMTKATKSIAPPSYSYHTVSDFDVGVIGWGYKNFTPEFASSREFEKMTKLDYIGMRYTHNNKDGVRFEPWHVEVI